MRYMDYYFSKEGTVYSWAGAPETKPEDTLGMYKGWTLTEDNITTYPDVEEGRYRDSNTIKHNIITPVGATMGNRSMAQDDSRIVYGLKPIGGWNWNDYTRYDHWYRDHVKDDVWPYLADSYPGTIYLPVDVNTRLSDLGTVINDYVSKESAKFITGANSLSNIDKYYSDLDALGFKEYQDIYINAYGTYQANLKK
jgi:putative aldouronate transport system substrate-binding protein